MSKYRQNLATKLYEILEGAVLTGDKADVPLDKIITPSQRYSLVMQIIEKLPTTNLEKVEQFNRATKVQKEDTHIVTDFKHRELCLGLLIEEVLELAFSLGYTRESIYNTFIAHINKVAKQKLKPELLNVLDAIVNIQFVSEYIIDVFNLNSIIEEAQEEVFKSNMSKLIPVNEDTEKILIETVDKLSAIQPITSENLKNGYVVVKNRNTNKILKPITFIKPNLIGIIEKHLNKE